MFWLRLEWCALDGAVPSIGRLILVGLLGVPYVGEVTREGVMDEIEGTELRRRWFRELIERWDPEPSFDDEDDDEDGVGC